MPRETRLALALALGFTCLSGMADAQEQAGGDVAELVGAMSKRLEELERRNADVDGQLEQLRSRNADLDAQNRSLVEKVDELTRKLSDSNAKDAVPPPPSLPSPWTNVYSNEVSENNELDADTGVTGPPAWTEGVARNRLLSASRFVVGDYDEDLGQFVLVRPRDDALTPFELRFDAFTQARYTNFARTKNTWVDAEDVTRPVQSFDSTEVTRNFLVFSGYAIDPRLQFTTMVFSSTAINDTLYLGWMNYRFNRAFDLRVGNWMLPGTREWLESFRWTLGADRLMATTFFRPNISPGVWAQGEPIDGLNYVAMVANSLNRFTQGVSSRVGSALAFGGTVWYEPTDDYGVGISDAEYHETMSFRFGTNLNLAHESNQGFTFAAIQNPEDTIIRVSDGTPLFRPGVLGPGVELESTNLQLWTIDAAMKYRGLGLSAEYFFRWLNGFDTVGGPSRYNGLFDTGMLLQGGYFVVPHRLELFARSSFVTGRFGGGSEYGGGVNWYPRGARTWRTTFEVLHIDGSPAQNFLTGYRAGETGTLFQLQWMTDF